MNNSLHKGLAQLLADTYAVYLKTQNYHWHVRGAQFKSLHELFEAQYEALADAVDTIAERIVMLGGVAPASFSQFQALTTIAEGDSHTSSAHMIQDLCHSHRLLIATIRHIITLAQTQNDEGTVTLMSERIGAHEKMVWMLDASGAASSS